MVDSCCFWVAIVAALSRDMMQWNKKENSWRFYCPDIGAFAVEIQHCCPYFKEAVEKIREYLKKN